MANKPRKRIDYAGWSVDIFDNDAKIDKLLDAHGWVGFSIYFYLCMKAFGSDGYFYKWCFDLCASTARKMGGGVGAGTVQEAVGYCLQIGLFDQRLFEEWGVLTSRGIQRSYWAVASKRRVRSVFKELWLLDENESEGLIFVPLNSELQQTNDHLQQTNSDLQATNDTVVKGSVVKDNKDIVATPAEPKSATTTYDTDSFEIKCVDMLIKSCLDSFPNSKVPRTLEEKQKWATDIERMKRIDGRSEQDIMQALRYAIKDSFWKSNIRSTKKFREKFETLFVQSKGRRGNGSKDKFNQFSQNEYDFDDLERRLLSN